jgi:hypothetical protein
MVAIVFLVLGLLRIRLAWAALGMLAVSAAQFGIEFAAGREVRAGDAAIIALGLLMMVAAYVIGGAIRTGIDRLRGVTSAKT